MPFYFLKNMSPMSPKTPSRGDLFYFKSLLLKKKKVSPWDLFCTDIFEEKKGLLLMVFLDLDFWKKTDTYFWRSKRPDSEGVFEYSVFEVSVIFRFWRKKRPLLKFVFEKNLSYRVILKKIPKNSLLVWVFEHPGGTGMA